MAKAKGVYLVLGNALNPVVVGPFKTKEAAEAFDNELPGLMPGIVAQLATAETPKQFLADIEADTEEFVQRMTPPDRPLLYPALT